MCIIVDTNVLGSVLDPSSSRHKDFVPVLRWLVYGEGKMVFGGSTYSREAIHGRFGRLIVELSRQRKTVILDTRTVDSSEAMFQTMLSSYPDFDDPHLLAMFHVSGCHLLCSDDKRADRFVKNLKEFSRLMRRRRRTPKIYRQASHQHLLCSKNIASCCLPKITLGSQAKQLVITAMGMKP